MVNKRRDKKYAKKIIDSLSEPAPLNNNPGKIDRVKHRRPSSKVRRHSGRVTPNIIKPMMKWGEIIKNALEPIVFWDDWLDYRDGFRDISEEELKQKDDKMKKQNKIRKARKEKCQLTSC